MIDINMSAFESARQLSSPVPTTSDNNLLKSCSKSPLSPGLSATSYGSSYDSTEAIETVMPVSPASPDEVRLIFMTGFDDTAVMNTKLAPSREIPVAISFKPITRAADEDDMSVDDCLTCSSDGEFSLGVDAFLFDNDDAEDDEDLLGLDLLADDDFLDEQDDDVVLDMAGLLIR